jgi:siroheme synthase (precorrin-2 oxidase/ferrochelatase)
VLCLCPQQRLCYGICTTQEQAAAGVHAKAQPHNLPTHLIIIFINHHHHHSPCFEQEQPNTKEKTFFCFPQWTDPSPPVTAGVYTGANDQQAQLQQRQKQLLVNKEQLVEQQRVVEPDKL